MVKQDKDILILGGMGPVAALGAEQALLEVVSQQGILKDQDYPSFTMAQHAFCIPDRTENWQAPKSIAKGAMYVLKRYAELNILPHASSKRKIVWIPCNSFHMPNIWDEFENMLVQEKLNGIYELVNMIEETVQYMMKLGRKKVGLLSTNGTRMAQTYHDKLKAFDVFEVPEEEQQAVHDLIYGAHGIKTELPINASVLSALEGFVKNLSDRGAKAVILGCAALSLALPDNSFKGIELINPVKISARTVLNKAGWAINER